MNIYTIIDENCYVEMFSSSNLSKYNTSIQYFIFCILIIINYIQKKKKKFSNFKKTNSIFFLHIIQFKLQVHFPLFIV